MNPVRSQNGFSLVELMVGLALGAIATLAVFQTLSSFETQRLKTRSGVDMQQNGLLALYTIEQDIRSAGFGLIDTNTTPGKMPCTNVNAYTPATGSTFDSSPLKIANGGAGTDIITINSLNSDEGGIVTGGGAAKLVAPLSSIATMTVETPKALHDNDYILVNESGLNCSLLQVTGFTGVSGVDIAAVANSTGDDTVVPAFPSYTTAATVINLGSTAPSFAKLKYQTDASYNLNRSTDNGETWNAVASNIVTVAAQYGVATAGSQAVACWTDAAANASGTAPCTGIDWSTPSAAQVAQIKAIRVAIVARSAQKQGSSGACTTTTTVPPSWTGGPDLTDSITAITDWGCYRYKVYQTIIPVRNVIWGNL